MAYLLTEIALEMLGCRFYDIYGLPHEIRYITNEEISSTGQSTLLKNDLHLETLLDIDGSNTASNSTSGASSSSTASTSAGASTSSGAKRNPGIIDDRPASTFQLISPEIKKEVQSIQRQLLQQRCLAMTDCKLKANATDKDLHIVTEALIRNEQGKLITEVHTLQSLRQALESAVKIKL